MSGNTFGKIFKVTTFGESHGKALGCIIDGCPPNLKIDESDIQRGQRMMCPCDDVGKT